MMSAIQRRTLVGLGLGLLTLSLVLTGCVGNWSPEEGVALTATIESYTVPTKVPEPEPEATAQPTAEPLTPEPEATEDVSEAPTPVAAAPTDSSVADLPVGTQVGQLPPDFNLQDAAGQAVHLRSLQGQPTVVIFWASWCPHCEKEMPLLQAMYEEYGDDGLAVVGVNVPGLGGDTKEQALAFIEEHGIGFPVVFDDGGTVYQDYRVQGVPNLFFIDKDGLLTMNRPGAMEIDALEAQIKQILGEG